MITKRFTIAPPRHGRGAFTLAELLVSVAVLALLVLMLTQLINNAAPIARTAGKHIDTDTQARVVLDRIAVDFAQMLKRTDVDYYLKQPNGNYHGHGNGHGYGNKVQSGQQGSDQIAFFSAVPGYYPSTGAQSPVSLVAYRVNQDSTSASYLKLERMGKGLLWNGVSTSNNPPTNSNYTSPIVFLPLLINDRWPAATDGSTANADYEVVGPQVFRFEYYYLLKNGNVTDVPWNTDAGHTSINGLADIEAVAVTIAVIDPQSRPLILPSSLFDLASDMADFKDAKGNGNPAKKIGDMEDQWNTAVLSAVSTGKTSTNSSVPPAAASAIRIYNRYFDLKTL
jgi:hypothetical protein